MASDDNNANGMQDNIRAQFASKSTEMLERICEKNDTYLYTEETFDLIREILKERRDGTSAEPAISPAFEADVPRHRAEKQNSDFFSFRTMITVSWVKFNYVLGGILVGLLGLWFAFMGVAEGDGVEIFRGLCVVLIGNLVWRLFCEAWIVFFRIHEALVSIDKKLEKPRPEDELATS